MPSLGRARNVDRILLLLFEDMSVSFDTVLDATGLKSSADAINKPKKTAYIMRALECKHISLYNISQIF